jgi:choline dehydrogenase-like flavoprotein
MLEYHWKAWDQLGIPRQREGAAGDATNLVRAPSSLDPVTRTRSDARAAHYEPYKNRSNYHLLTNHQVTEILFSSNTDNGTTLQAIGVNVLKVGSTGPKVIVRARYETIIAAGAIWTPWLLQRSGIGPKDVLSAARIPVQKDLPGVGANFQDHPVVYGGAIYSFANPPFPNPSVFFVNKTFWDAARAEYEQNRTGPFTIARGNQAAFLALQIVDSNYTSLIEQGRQQDSREYLPSAYADERLYKGFLKQKEVTLDLLNGTSAAAFEFPFNSGAIGASLQRPLSRGTITLNPSAPLSAPLVAYNTLQNPLDLQQSIAMIKFIRKVIQQPAFEPLGVVAMGPAANATSDREIEGLLRGGLLAPTFAHPSGTTAMGREEEGAVVDRELRVFGTRGLSVVDAGVMPVVPAGHLCATVYAVAEKVSLYFLGCILEVVFDVP